MEDLVEEIVGEISDEHDPDRDVSLQPDGSYVVSGNFDLDHLAELFHVFENFFEKGAKILACREWKVQQRDFLLQLRRDFQGRRDQDHGLETVLQVQRDLLELPNDGKIVFRQKRMEILKDKNGRLDLLDDLIERRQWVLRRGIAMFL